MDDPSSLDEFFSGSALLESTKILFVGRESLYAQFLTVGLDQMGYIILHSATVEDAFNFLLQDEFVMVLLDLDDPNIDVVKFSNIVRKNNKLTRILVVTELIETKVFSFLYNHSSVDGILPLPLNMGDAMKVISEQEARYEINKATVSFVSQPPKLSKASFLLLDPSLSFGDENQPLNFVGIMIVSQTVPRYTRWWEKTLSQDEYLLAGYLSSITALGDDLFQNQESLKEINFGGISVIFRFHETLQISFLVRNLTRHNFEKAEDRITELVSQIISNCEEQLSSGILSDDDYALMDTIVDYFDKADKIEEQLYDSIQDEKELKTSDLQYILLYGSDHSSLSDLQNQLMNEKLFLPEGFLDYIVEFTTNETEAVDIVRGKNVGLLLLDSQLGTDARVASDFSDFAKEMNYALKVILLERSPNIHQDMINMINSDYADYIYEYGTRSIEMMEFVQKGLESSWNIKLQISKGETSAEGTDGSVVAKLMLRENLDAYEEEVKPELTGVLITKGMDPIFNMFWKEVNFDISMLTGMVASLKNVGGEMFTEEEKIDGLEMADSFIFVRDIQNHLFIYFTDNVNANTSVIVSQEVDAITSLFNELITEAGDLIPLAQLQPFFEKIANKAHYSFTEILGETKKKRTPE